MPKAIFVITDKRKSISFAQKPSWEIMNRKQLTDPDRVKDGCAELLGRMDGWFDGFFELEG